MTTELSVLPTSCTTLLWLDGNDEQESEIWREVWEKSHTRRPHDHPGYLRAMCPEGYVPILAIYDHAPGVRIFYPFYARDLTELPFCPPGIESLLHLLSPYGYGGPLYEGPRDVQQKVSDEFDAYFSREAARRGAVSEFVREDIFQERLAMRKMGNHFEQQLNVVVRLDRTAEEIWRNYTSKVRKNVNRARQCELRVVFDDSGVFLDQFLSIYLGTMERTGAAESFFMAKETFLLLGRTLGAAGGLAYVHVFLREQVISTELLLLSSDTIYSFLGGTLAAAFDMRPNDLLKHEVIEWGRRNGFKHYLLGGGIKPGDGTFIYKKSFDPEGIQPFFVRRVIHDPKKYRLLCEQRRGYEETEQGRDWQPDADYFPEYLS